MKSNKMASTCRICRQEENLVTYKEAHICKNCITYIKEMA